MRTTLLLIGLFFIPNLLVEGQRAPPAPVVNGKDKKEEKTFNGTFLVVAPSVVRPNRPYAVSVNLLKDIPSSNTITLEIQNDKNDSIAQTSQQNLPTGQPRTMRIDSVPANSLTEGGQYWVVVKGMGGGRLLFTDRQPVRREEKSLSIFVQTDKAVYKPGAVVRFRVVVVDPSLKPYTKTINVQIKDANDNIITQYNNKQLTNGVYGNEIKLSDEPPLGNWKLDVKTVDGNGFEKTFEVKKYVLPKFEVTVEHVKGEYMNVKDDLVVKVSAKYTYGKGVEGPVAVFAKYPWVWAEKQPILKLDTLDKEGEAIIRFTNAELKSKELISKWGWDQIAINATVTETLTGKKRVAETKVQTRVEDRQIKVETQGDNFKPGLPLEFLVAVTDLEGKPIRGAKYSKLVQIEIEYTPKWEPDFNRRPPPPMPVEFDGNEGVPRPGPEVFPTRPPPVKITEVRTLTSDGTITYTLTHIPKDTHNININVQHSTDGQSWEDRTKTINSGKYLKAAESPSNSFIKITQRNPGPVNAGDVVEFDVISTEDIDVVTYQVVARGFITVSQEQRMRGRSTTIRIPTNAEMAPKARFIVYTVRSENQEIVVDGTDFQVKGLFENDVSVSINKKESEPGKTITVTVKADPNSYVGVLGVDQSVLLLKSGNDISQDLVEKDIEDYGTNPCRWCGPWNGPFARGKRSIWWPWGINGADAKSFFKNAGLVVLTDALLHSAEPDWKRNPWVRRRLFSPVSAPRGRGRAGFAAAPRSPSVAQPQASRPPPAPKAPKTRTKFPETWIWADITSPNVTQGRDGTISLKTTVPDTITSWVVSGFAVNDRTGLGVAPESAKLKVFRPFFIQMNLPYSVKRGEKLALQLIVFNYMDQPQEVDVILKHEETSGFDVINEDGSVMKGKKGERKTYNIRRITVKGGGGAESVFFPIIPTKLGEVKMHVSAVAGSAGDAVERPLLVEPEGFRVERNEPVVIDLSRSASFKKTVTPNYPRDVIADSESAELSIVGDIMGPVLQNIDNLVRMPYGCGEQNMVNFVPNIVVMRYLKATSRLTPDIEAKATKFMEAGYQRELTYKRKDHSFSAFGDSDKTGSTFLTAFVVKSFKQAEKFIFVDEKVVNQSIGFLLEKQTPDGDFQEDGSVHNSGLLGGNKKSDSSIPMTAYILIALHMNGRRNTRAQKYLEDNLREANTPYSSALVTYALHLVDSSLKEEAFRIMEGLKVEKDGLVRWEAERAQRDADRPSWWWEPPPADVESTSYALLTYILRNSLNQALPIVRWLVSNRNNLGGYSSTQDTVMALQALGAYAEKSYSPDFNVNIDATGGQRFVVNPSNALVLQTGKIQNPRKAIEISASGRGIVYAQLSWRYNLPVQRNKAAFSCRPNAREDGDNAIKLNLCCRYLKGKKSNMAVVGVDALSGFEFDEEATNQLTDKANLQRVELIKGNTHTDLYFNSLSRTETCVELTTERAFKVSEQKPAVIQVYDYYKPSDRIDTEYMVGRLVSFGESCKELACWEGIPPCVGCSGGSVQACFDVFKNCNIFCFPSRQDKPYRDWFQSNKKWLTKHCSQSCQIC